MDASGKLIGYMERQFSIFSKKFRVCDAQGKVTSQMYSGLFKIWTFPFKKDGREVAKISKKWAGAVTEIFLDSDNFLLEIVDKSITPDQRAVLLCASVFIDLLFFENNQARGINAIDLIPGVDT